MEQNRFAAAPRNEEESDEEESAGLLSENGLKNAENGRRKQDERTFQVWEQKVRKEGAGVMLYFELLKSCVFILITGLVICLVEFIFRLAMEDEKGSRWTERTFRWWTSGGHLLSTSALVAVLVVACVSIQWSQISEWTILLKEVPSVVNRSILVSSPALRGSLGLVPEGPALAKFFAEKYGAVENVLILTDIGKLIRLSRLQVELKRESLKAERAQQTWRPRRGYFSKLFCCRTCRKMARKAGESQQDRFQRWLDRIESKILTEEETHQTESIGCAIITFEDQRDARAALRDTYLGEQVFDGYSTSIFHGDLKSKERIPSSPSSVSFDDDDDDDDDIKDNGSDPFHFIQQNQATHQNRVWNALFGPTKRYRTEFGQEKDHASRWFFSPSLQSRVRFGDNSDPVFVRMPPESNDIDFESFRPGADLVSPTSFRRLSVVVYGLGFAVIGMLLGGIIVVTPPSILSDLLFVAGGCAGLWMALIIGSSRRSLLPERPFSTFSLRHREDYGCGFLFSMAFFVSLFTMILVGVSTNYLRHETTSVDRVFICFWILTAHQGYSLAMSITRSDRFHRSFGTRDMAPSFALGFLSAETFTCFSCAMILAPWSPFVLFSSTAFIAAKLLAEKSHVLSLTEHISPKFGPEVAISVVNTMPLVAAISCTLPTGFALATMSNSMTLEIYIACILCCLTLIFMFAWAYLQRSRTYLFRYPALDGAGEPRNVGHETSRSKNWRNGTNGSSSPGVNISFDSESPGLSTSQVQNLASIYSEGYLLPEFHRKTPHVSHHAAHDVL